VINAILRSWWGKPAIFLTVLMALWQYGLRYAGVPKYILPLPSEIVDRFLETAAIQLYQLGVTTTTTLIGLLLAVVVGVVLALSVIYVPWLKGIVLPTLAAFNSIPKIAIAPLFIIWFGLGLKSKIALAFLLALFPIFVNALTGMGEIEGDVLDLSRLAGGTRLRVFIKVRLMNALPYLADALKVAFPLAIVGSIVGEFIGGNTGIGYLILSGQLNMDTALVFSALVLITLLTMLGIGLVAVFEHLFLKWRPSQRVR
jgi:NitT/TauT family transport system permease protein